MQPPTAICFPILSYKSLTQVSLMTDYVVVLTEKYDLLHLQLLDARQLIDKNHIVIERDKVDKVTTC